MQRGVPCERTAVDEGHSDGGIHLPGHGLDAGVCAARPCEEGNREVAALLAEVLWNARVVTALEIEPDVVTMNTRARVRDLDSGDPIVVDLSFPEESARDNGKTSVFSPIGALILGRQEGCVVSRRVKDRHISLCIEKVLFQPEAMMRASTAARHYVHRRER